MGRRKKKKGRDKINKGREEGKGERRFGEVEGSRFLVFDSTVRPRGEL